MTRSLSSITISRRAFLKRMGALAVTAASLPLLMRVRALSQSADPLRVIIAGGGLAGLCAAYELEQLGHECLVLEADTRHTGGRARTLRFDRGLYGEAGAMRIPKVHDLTRHYVSEFGLSLRPFISYNPKAYTIARGQKVRAAAENQLAGRYDLTPEEASKSAGQLWAASMGAILDQLSAAEKEDLLSDQPQTTAVRDLDTLSLVQSWKNAAYSQDAREYLAVLLGNEQYMQTALTEHLREEILGTWSGSFDEIVGGTDTLPSAFAGALQTKPRMGAKVVRIEQDVHGVTAVYQRSGKTEHERGDFLLCTLPFSVMENLELQPALSPGKQRAIRELNYDSSAKTLAVTRERFWESKDGIYGGGTVTDLFSGSTYYPSDNAGDRDPQVSAGPGVLLASYTWRGQARRQAGFAPRERMKAVMETVSSFHPELNQPGMVQRTATWSWDRHPLNRGAYAFFLPGQFTDLYADIIKPEGRIFFAGEHASHDHSWMQGAFASALHAVDEMLAAP